jgi:three-Cys-motif partner protein
MTTKAIPTSDWILDKLKRLKEMTKVLQEISPETYTPVDHDYGFWSLKKEMALMYLAYPFQNIANSPLSHFSSYYYIDLFAGSGLMKVAEDTFYVGSPVVAIGSTIKEKPFSKYICIEADQSRCKVLQQRLDAACTHYQTCKAEVVTANTNIEIGNVLQKKAPRGNTCFLAFVDPEKYTDLKWSTLETLMMFGKGDIILNFPSMSVNRNLPNRESYTSLSTFVGDTNWIDMNNLTFDNFLDYFMDKMRLFRREVHSVRVNGAGKNRLFDLVFATDSQGINNSLQDLSRRLDGMETETIEGLQQVALGKQKQLGCW